MNNLHNDIINYKIVHGRAGIKLYYSYLLESKITINPDIFAYTIIDKPSSDNSFVSRANISNNNIHIIEIDQYVKWESKIKESITYIKNNFDKLPTFVLYVDAFDVSILNNIDNPKEMLEFYDCRMLFNGEANYTHTGFPEPSFKYFDKLYYDEAEKYGNLNREKFGAPLQKGLNAGVFLGYKEDVLSILEETYNYMMDDFNKGFPYGCKDDQCLLRFMHNKHYNIISVDVFNKYFLHCTPLSSSEDKEDSHHYQFFDRYKSLYKK
jgi:hypothetical protein